MQPSLSVLILSLLLGLQPITTDLYLPALPALTAGFGAPMAQAQLTLTALLLAFGLSQLIWGPLSDRFGRRPILLLGLSAYVLASLASTLGLHTGWAIMLPFYLFMLGHGVHQPCSQSGAVGPFPQAAGASSALNGFLMMAAAFAMGGWLGSHMDGTVFPLAYGLWFWSVLIALATWTLVQKYGKTLGH